MNRCRVSAGHAQLVVLGPGWPVWGRCSCRGEGEGPWSPPGDRLVGAAGEDVGEAKQAPTKCPGPKEHRRPAGAMSGPQMEGAAVLAPPPSPGQGVSLTQAMVNNPVHCLPLQRSCAQHNLAPLEIRMEECQIKFNLENCHFGRLR